MLLLDFHCKENDGMTGAVQLIQAFLMKYQTPTVRQLLTLLISGESESAALLQSFHQFPYNENPTRALNTITLKCCLP